MYAQKLYQLLAGIVDARQRCIKQLEAGTHKDNGMVAMHTERLQRLVRAHLPSGSGFDSGTTWDSLASTPDKLVFQTSFHHMAESGAYDGWTVHTVTVKPSLVHGYTLRVSGVNRNDVKEYIAECFQTALDTYIGQEPHTGTHDVVCDAYFTERPRPTFATPDEPEVCDLTAWDATRRIG